MKRVTGLLDWKLPGEQERETSEEATALMQHRCGLASAGAVWVERSDPVLDSF